MNITRIDHIVLTVANIEATCKFYSKVLGFQVHTFIPQQSQNSKEPGILNKSICIFPLAFTTCHVSNSNLSISPLNGEEANKQQQIVTYILFVSLFCPSKISSSMVVNLFTKPKLNLQHYVFYIDTFLHSSTSLCCCVSRGVLFQLIL